MFVVHFAPLDDFSVSLLACQADLGIAHHFLPALPSAPVYRKLSTVASSSAHHRVKAHIP